MVRPARREHVVEILTTVLLALAAVTTAWSTYQSTVWRGEQASHTSRSTTSRIESSDAATRAGQLTAIDVATFTQWLNAHAAGDTAVADFYQERFRAEFEPAFSAWLAADPFSSPSAPKTPFEMPQYRLAATDEAKRLDAAASAELSKAAKALERADEYMLAVVLFAVSLFFAGIATKLPSVGQRTIVLSLGGILFVGTAIWLAALPVRAVL